jgi:hypothetical protein
MVVVADPLGESFALCPLQIVVLNGVSKLFDQDVVLAAAAAVNAEIQEDSHNRAW